MAKKASSTSSQIHTVGLGKVFLVRASVIFLVLIILLISSFGGAVYVANKNGSLANIVDQTKSFFNAFKTEEQPTTFAPYPVIAVTAQPIMSPTSTPSATKKPAITQKMTPAPTPFDQEAWFKQAQEENRKKYQQFVDDSNKRYEQFKQQSEQNYENFKNQ